MTRGVNKGVKEDFRAALERQICRSDDGFEPFLKAFFQDEKESLLRWFSRSRFYIFVSSNEMKSAGGFNFFLLLSYPLFDAENRSF